VADGPVGDAADTAREMATEQRMSRSTEAYARNATTSYNQNMQPDGKQSTEPKRELVEWRILTISVRKKKSGGNVCVPFNAHVKSEKRINSFAGRKFYTMGKRFMGLSLLPFRQVVSS